MTTTQEIADRITKMQEVITLMLSCKAPGGLCDVCRRLGTKAVTPPHAPQFPLKEDKAADRTKVLSALKKAGSKGCTNLELNEICLRYGGRIHELRKLGFKIVTEKVSNTVFRYELKKIACNSGQSVKGFA